MKNTKKELVDLLKNFDKTNLNEKGKELIDLFKVDYKEDPKGFTKKDLVDYIEKVMDNLLSKQQQFLPIENEEKKKVVVKKKEEKKQPKKKEEKKEEKKAVKEDILPKTFKSDLGTLKRVDTSYSDIVKRVDKGEQLYIATYWTPELIKEYDYELGLGLAKDIKEFPNNLDILQIMYIDKTICYGLSLYSTQVYPFTPEDFSFSYDHVRVSAGMEFSVYELVE